jgi:hypothetical protein
LEDIPALYRALSGRTRHVYQMAKPEENGSFLHLVQHYGYPTPLLDWTYSPYVAAFCAFRRVSADSGDAVRIFVFDAKSWRDDLPQIERISNASPHFSIIEFAAIDNDRITPQQALSTVANVDDVESHIRHIVKLRGKTYLSVIDLSAKQRTAVIRDLARMGISAGAMFPGLDGACEELRERMFLSPG